jgi:hypothetical protein
MNTQESGSLNTQGGGPHCNAPCHGVRILPLVGIRVERYTMLSIATNVELENTELTIQSAMRITLSRTQLKRGISALISHYLILKRGARKLAMQIARESAG